MFQVIEVDPQRAESLEQLGTKRKFWYREGERLFLFKADERGTGEDWAEKLSCELAKLLDLPCVQYELASETGTLIPGVVCETCSPPPWSMKMGNELLLARDPSYPAERKFGVQPHTVDAVVSVLKGFQLPPVQWNSQLPVGICTAVDVYIGYAMLDAWVANQDRHHQNWAALANESVLHLCPTYDHGAALARNINNAERSERMASRDKNRQVAAFALKARSAFYGQVSDMKTLTTFEAWHRFSAVSTKAGATWLAQLAKLPDATVSELVENVPSYRMATVCKEFTLQLLNENRRRLLEDLVS